MKTQFNTCKIHIKGLENSSLYFLIYTIEIKPIISVKKPKAPQLGGEASINSSIKNDISIILINNNSNGFHKLNFFTY